MRSGGTQEIPQIIEGNLSQDGHFGFDVERDGAGQEKLEYTSCDELQQGSTEKLIE